MGLNSKMANREVQKLIFKEYNSKKPFLNLDFANTSTTELTGETMYAYGGHGHPKRVAFSGEKGGTLTIETQMYGILSDVDKMVEFRKQQMIYQKNDALTELLLTAARKIDAVDPDKVNLKDAVDYLKTLQYPRF